MVLQGQGANPKVDASGELPNGKKFSNAEDFKRLLLDDLDAFHSTFIEKLATYGLRRSMTFDDHHDISTIAAESKKADYRVRSIIETFVLSDLFQKR